MPNNRRFSSYQVLKQVLCHLIDKGLTYELTECLHFRRQQGEVLPVVYGKQASMNCFTLSRGKYVL